jgi:heat shock protein HspQ
VSKKFTEAGIEVFDMFDIGPAYNITEEMWKALAESWALVVLIKPGAIPSSVAVEIGAASAWQKPVYIVTTAKGEYQLPTYISQYELVKSSEISNLIELISKGRKPLTDKDRNILKEAYLKLQIPTDQLFREPRYIQKLQKMLRGEYNLTISNERMMQELLRLRKSGRLARLRRKNRWSIR